MEVDLVSKLEKFGLTVNQAKVYLSIVQYGKTRVSQISKDTQLHRQDIYKLLPKLEKMGLITKTIDKPFMLEPLTIEKSLGTLISKEKQKYDLQISCLENNLSDLKKSIHKQEDTKQEGHFSVLTTETAIKNKIQLNTNSVKKELIIVTNGGYIKRTGINYFRDFLRIVAENRAKTKMLIATTDDKTVVNQTIESIAPSKGYFVAKLLNKNINANYQIIDDKELSIATEQKTQTGYPCIFCTNDRNIIDIFKEHFRTTWNSSQATMIYNNIIILQDKEVLTPTAVSIN